jgi:hypothetical protein
MPDEAEGFPTDLASAGESIWARKGEPVTVTHGEPWGLPADEFALTRQLWFDLLAVLDTWGRMRVTPADLAAYTRLSDAVAQRQSGPGAPADAGPVSQDPASRTGSHSAAGMDPLFDITPEGNPQS